MAALIPSTIAACTFDPSGVVFDPPLAELTESGRALVFEDEGNIVAFHGFGCSESNKRGEEDFLRVQESVVDLPDYVTAATVFLNGWDLSYLSGDHDIRGLGTGIATIEIADRKLNWEAGRVIADGNFDDGYRWCYHYIIIAWNEIQIDARIDQNDGEELSDLVAVSGSENNNTTALKVLSRFVHNSDFTSRASVAVLPRGYGFEWEGGSITATRDHNLLQLAYNLDYSEAFIQREKDYSGLDEPSLPSPADYVDSGFISWDTKTILKDNRLRRDYGVGEIVSVIGGSDVGIIQPPFTVLPREDIGLGGGCIGEAGGIKTQEYTIENIPFEYAVPMLAGWELAYSCDDENVTRIGIWITEFQYDKSADDPVGTLRYTLSSILRDRDNSPGHLSKHRVSILGMKPVAGLGEPTAVILSPQDGDILAPDTIVTLQGEGVDPEDGRLSGSNLMWFSDIDGLLGSGTSLQAVLSGPELACNPEFVSHSITLRVTDSDAHQAEQQIVVSVGRPC